MEGVREGRGGEGGGRRDWWGWEARASEVWNGGWWSGVVGMGGVGEGGWKVEERREEEGATGGGGRCR